MEWENISFEEVAAMFGDIDMGMEDGVESNGLEAGMIPHMPGAVSLSPDEALPPAPTGGTSYSDPNMMSANMMSDLGIGDLEQNPALSNLSPDTISSELADLLQERDAERMDSAMAYQAKGRR